MFYLIQVADSQGDIHESHLFSTSEVALDALKILEGRAYYPHDVFSISYTILELDSFKETL